MTTFQDDDDEICKSLEVAADTFFQKGGHPGYFGEQRVFNGRKYTKTDKGWRVHGPRDKQGARSDKATDALTSSKQGENNHRASTESEEEQTPTKAHSIGGKEDNNSTSNEGGNIGSSSASTSKPTAAESSPNPKMDLVKKFTQEVMEGKAKSMIAYGKGSLSEKQSAVSGQLQGKKQFSSSDTPGANTYDYVKTNASSAEQFFAEAYNHNGKTLLLTGIDSALQNQETAKLISDAISSKSLYLPENQLTDHRGDPLPDAFKFTGKLLITSNLSKDKIPASLKGHSLSVDTSAPSASVTTDEIVSKNTKGLVTRSKENDSDWIKNKAQVIT